MGKTVRELKELSRAVDQLFQWGSVCDGLERFPHVKNEPRSGKFLPADGHHTRVFRNSGPLTLIRPADHTRKTLQLTATFSHQGELIVGKVRAKDPLKLLLHVSQTAVQTHRVVMRAT